MSTIKQTLADLEFTKTLRLLAQAYEEIAVLKMQRVRTSVFSTRQFLAELSSVFYDVRVNYEDTKKKAGIKGKHRLFGRPMQLSITTHKKNGKTVSVFLSSREKLYGDIIKKVFHLFQFQLFLLGSKKVASDIVIVGRYGKQLVDQLQNAPAYTFFDFPDNNVSMTQLEPLLKLLNQYEKVNVFYGKMETVMNQSALVGSISGETPLETKPDAVLTKHAFFFEPSVETIMTFFETEVFYSLFYQTFHEIELARLASRVKAMEEALGNIDRSEGQLLRDARRIQKRVANKKQLDMLSGIALWKKM
ncbi:hypothetical protein BH11PAT1_BH11PAT1_7460 [soil metagenome]